MDARSPESGGGGGSSSLGNNQLSSGKHFVWGWGRLTPAPLLLTPSSTALHQPQHSMLQKGGGGGSSSKSSEENNNNSSPEKLNTSASNEEQYPFPSSTSHSSPPGVGSSAPSSAASASSSSPPHCTLSPTLIESMDNSSFRSIHTASHHTVAITHSGCLYSWMHTPGSALETGPAIEVEAAEWAAYRGGGGRTNAEARAELARMRSNSSNAAGANSPAASSSSSAAAAAASAQAGRHSLTITQVSRSRSGSPVGMREQISHTRSVLQNSNGEGALSASSLPSASERKFRRVIVTPSSNSAASGVLRLGGSPTPPAPAISAAALGRNQLLAVTTAGQVLSWDWNTPSDSAQSSSSSSSSSSTSSPAAMQPGANSLLMTHPLPPASPSHSSHAACSSSSSLATTTSNSSISTSSPSTPTRLLSSPPSSNGSSFVMGLLPTPVPLPPSSSGMGPTLVNAVAIGGQFNLLATVEGAAYSWGQLGTHGRLGQGPPPNPTSSVAEALANAASASSSSALSSSSAAATPEKLPSSSSLASMLSPRLRSDSPTPEKHSVFLPRPILSSSSSSSSPPHHVTRVAAGWSHGALLHASGSLAMFGCGLSGRLGSGNQLDQWVPQPLPSLQQTHIMEVACGYHHTLAVDVQGRVWVFGGNEHGQLGLGGGDRIARGTPESIAHQFPDEVVAVSCGAFHSAVVTSIGDLYTFGYGKFGQLGFGDTQSSSLPRLVSSLNGMDVCLVACGGDYTIAVTDHFMVMQMDYFSTGGGINVPSSTDPSSHPPAMLSVEEDDEVASTSSQFKHRAHSAASPSSAASFSSSNPTHPSPSHPSGGTSGAARSMSRTSSGNNLQAAYNTNNSSSLSSLRSPSPLPSPPILSHLHNNNINSAVPPTPVIFEERDASDILLSWDGTGSSINSSTHAAAAVAAAVALDDEPTPTRIRTSASSNALGDLVGHNPSGPLSKSSSFGGPRSSGDAGSHTPNRPHASNSIDHSTSSPASLSNSTSSSSSSSLSASLALAQQKKTIFQLVKEVFSFPPMIHPDLKAYLPTVKPSSSPDPIEASDSSAPPGSYHLQHASALASAAASSSSSSSSSSSASSASVVSPLSSPSSQQDDLNNLPSDFRPPTLNGSSTRKSAVEVARHRDEVARMNLAYKSKLRREAKGKAAMREQELLRRKEADKESREQAKKQSEREARMDEAADIWLKQIVPNWSSSSRVKKCRELVQRVGCPPRVRGVVWPLALGNALMITPDLYEIFGQQATRARRNRLAELKAINNATNASSSSSSSSSAASSASPSSVSSPSSPIGRGGGGGLISSPSFTLGKESTFSYIDVDLTRTYPSLAFFQEECVMNDQLRHLLYVYCHYRPDVGYVQGMSYLAGNLLLYMSPYEAFVSFAHLINSPFFHVFLKLDTQAMQSRYRIFEELFHESEPELYRHFQSENISSELYFMEWSMTLFTKRLALDVVGRIWDYYFMCGEGVVYRTAVGILRALKSQFIQMPFDQIMKKLNQTPLDLSEDDLMSAMSDVKLSSSLKAKLKQLNPNLQDD